MSRSLGLMFWMVGCVPVDPGAAPTPIPMVSTRLPESLEEQAAQVLAQDAWRREERFREAADPGRSFRLTRSSAAALSTLPPEAVYQVGFSLFSQAVSREDGFGAADLPAMSRFQRGRRGGPDNYRCIDCHWRGGPAGGGDAAENAYLDGDGDTQASALARNPPSLVGLGVRLRLGQEMTSSLQAQRDQLLAAARNSRKTLRTELVAKGVSFGRLSAGPDGTLYTTELQGVSPDLVVRPLGWKGHEADLLAMVDDELLTHHGLQSTYLAETGPAERVGAGPRGDPDGDGVQDEFTEGQLLALSLYVAMAEVPTVSVPTRPEMIRMYASGRASFEALGCDTCHVPSLTLEDPELVLTPRDGAPPVRVDLSRESAEPRISADNTGSYPVWLYSDLKRHHMGSRLAEPRADRGVDADLFLTPPLWGISRSRPYLHDGSAPTLEDAILAHGGEAAAARDAYAALSDQERYPLRLFLASLTRATRLITP